MVEGARLEIVCRVTPTEGSNPFLSAIFGVNWESARFAIWRSWVRSPSAPPCSFHHLFVLCGLLIGDLQIDFCGY